ncbi:hypothetical protein Tsubulata_048988 [Turnera subulata]|uniref:Uncharacterized protein n=1 Tax=Turnera subulata TaxID=218843 RepID=A0A9Q0FYT1_9ROSI|nr:hypothetical protein Tsubulata_048988 [Turnera subulata]
MGKLDDAKCVFPLTSLQIGDLQSYLSDLSLFLAVESKKLYILVDNRPWLRDLGSRLPHLWQLMVTKSRLSPFANTKAQRGRREGKEASSESSSRRSKKSERWFSLIDAATLSGKSGFPHVKKLRNSLSLSSELHRTLSGFIVFEVAWANVRGINYLNELQTDTSLAIESKFMQRWEFDSINQAASCMSSWFSGTKSELLQLTEYLNSAIGDIFYDAEEELCGTPSFDDDDDEKIRNNKFWIKDKSPSCLRQPLSMCSASSEMNEPYTPPPTGPYKRRRVIRSIGTGVEFDFYSEETPTRVNGMSGSFETYISDCGSTIEAKRYHDVLILFRFNDRDLPFKLREIVMSDLRLLTLLEAGLPSWVLFLQSYPGFCHLYRPWMCPLVRALYVLISIVTVLIGFYDLYKNVPVLKASASRLCGPLFDWIETWEMVSRIKYLGTMLFLQNFKKAVTWFLAVTRATRSCLSFFTQPLVEPITEILGCLLPVWSMVMEVVRSSCSIVWIVTGSLCTALGSIIEVVLWPVWFLTSVIWSIVFSVLYPVFWMLWEVLYAPIRILLSTAGFVSFFCAWIWEQIGDIWRSTSAIFQLASASDVTVFRAVRSILNGFVAFFAACNRHRLRISLKEYSAIRSDYSPLIFETAGQHEFEVG